MTILDNQKGEPQNAVVRLFSAPMNRLGHWRAAVLAKLRTIIALLVSQGITMAGNALFGFLCVRLLPISDYAKYVVVFGFLSTLGILMDAGFSYTLLPLVGNRIDDLELISDFVATLRQLALWLFAVAVPVGIFVFPLIVRKQHWTWQTEATMIAIFLVGAWCARVAGNYGAVLIVRRDRAVWYRVQIASSFGTLALLCMFWAAHRLSAFTAILLGLAGIVFAATAYCFRARQLLGRSGTPSREKRKQIIHLAAPMIPTTVFYAFQGQISLFLIALFGYAQGIAGLGALARLSQIYALLGQMGPLLIEPYFAKLPKERLLRSYALAVSGAVGGSFVIASLAYFFPQVFLWVLGPKYAELHLEVFLMLTSSGISYIFGVIGTINNARKFVYWWNGIAIIIVTLTIQAFFLWKVDLSQLRAVLTMGIFTALGWVLVHSFTGIYGLIRGPRQIADVSSELSAVAIEVNELAEGVVEDA